MSTTGRLPHELDHATFAWMSAARWFAAKGDASGRLVVFDSASLPPGWLALVDRVDPTAGDAAGPAKRFVVPLVERDGTLDDAAATPAFAASLLDVVFGERVIAATRGRFRGRLVAAGPAARPSGTIAVDVVPIGGDASNTSLLVRESAAGWVVKLVRTSRPGSHPEVELGQVLAAAAWSGSPRLVGWVEYEPGEADPARHDEAAVVAVVHEHLPGCRSAWDECLERATSDWEGCLEIAGELGRTTAAMHAAIASSRDPACAPEPWTERDAADEGNRMSSHARSVFDRLASRRHSWPAGLAARLEKLLIDRDRLLSRLTIPAGAAAATRRIRVHGDYHLGQVLVRREAGRDRCFVIDFEGEPARPLEERRRKTAAAKDVAGMCRSFDYLLRVLAKEGRRKYSPADRAALESRFLTAYATAAGDAAWWPRDRDGAQSLVATYALDKAIYELAYEADNRPDWIDVPLSALEQQS